ncbi:MAG: hypothetical protein KAX78_11285, partial [Phycisphaerae bacterium]|nr:hypothetical protein [Phycisphaerae bacterium]
GNPGNRQPQKKLRVVFGSRSLKNRQAKSAVRQRSNSPASSESRSKLSAQRTITNLYVNIIGYFARMSSAVPRETFTRLRPTG